MEMTINKDDAEALRVWGEDAYKAMPKSVFALAAWHLANACCETLDSINSRFIEEIEALGANGFISAAQAKRAAKALRAGSRQN